MYLVHNIIILVNLHKYCNLSHFKKQVRSVLWRNMSKDHCYERLSQCFFFFAFEIDGNHLIFGSKLPTAYRFRAGYVTKNAHVFHGLSIMQWRKHGESIQSILKRDVG